MIKEYKYSLLKTLMNVKVEGKEVWRERIRNQNIYLHLLEPVFGLDITTKSYSFYPGTIYFGTPLTANPEYTKKTKSTWKKIKNLILKSGWKDVYAPFEKTDPHAKIPDKLNAFELSKLDHIRVLTAEVGLFDCNIPSHGIGQEIQLGIFMPVISFSQNRISRMVKGIPGSIFLNYKNEEELLELIKSIFERESYKKQPFYTAKCPKHITYSVFKGKECLRCKFKENIHEF